jgi:hypothetical protein
MAVSATIVQTSSTLHRAGTISALLRRHLLGDHAGEEGLVFFLQVAQGRTLVGLMFELFLEELETGLVFLNDLSPSLDADGDIVLLLDDAGVLRAESAFATSKNDNQFGIRFRTRCWRRAN